MSHKILCIAFCSGGEQSRRDNTDVAPKRRSEDAVRVHEQCDLYTIMAFKLYLEFHYGSCLTLTSTKTYGDVD